VQCANKTVHHLVSALVTAILLLQFMPLSLLLHLCMILSVMRLYPAYILYFHQSCGKYTSVFIFPSNCAFCCFACHLWISNKLQIDCLNRHKRRTYRILSTFHESDSSSWERSRLVTKHWEWSRTNVGWL